MRSLFAAIAVWAGLAGSVLAQQYPPPRTVQLPDPARWFGGLTLTDQDGRAVKLYDDLMAGQVVVINAFYASCRSVCPPVMGNLALVQQKEAIEGIKVAFISITIDPARDTPQALRLYAEHLGVQPGWHFLGGDAAAVTQALHRFGLDTDPNDPEDHLNIVYVANLRTGLWKKVFSLTPPEEIAEIVSDVAAR